MSLIVINNYLSWRPQKSNLLAWYDASDAASITASSGAVSQWSDKSGNGRHLTQGTGANQPSTGVATQNGLNAIRFTGAGPHNLSTGTISSFGPIKTIYIVVKTVGQIPSTSTYHYGARSNQVEYMSAGGETASGAQSGMYGYDGSIRALTGWMKDATMCWVARFDGNASSSSTTRRGSVNLSSAFTGSTAANTAITSFSLGAIGSNNCMSMDVCEILAYSVKHTDAEVAATESYLNAKWAYAQTSGIFAGMVQPDNWFDFSQTGLITESGGLVSAVTNLGRSGVAAQSASTNRPTTNSHTINGRNVLVFDGSDDYLAINDTMEVRGNCVLSVFKTNGFTTNASIYGPSGNGGFLWRIDQTTGKASTLKSNIIGISTATNAFTDAAAVVSGASFQNNSAWWHRKAKASNGSGTSTTFIGSSNTLQIGRDRATADCFKGDIGEIAGWKGWMNETEFAAYETAMATPWGL